MASESTDVEDGAIDKACVNPLLGLSLETVSNAEGDRQKAPESEMTMSTDMEDVACEGDGVGKSFNIVTYMKRRP